MCLSRDVFPLSFFPANKMLSLEPNRLSKVLRVSSLLFRIFFFPCLTTSRDRKLSSDSDANGGSTNTFAKVFGVLLNSAIAEPVILTPAELTACRIWETTFDWGLRYIDFLGTSNGNVPFSAYATASANFLVLSKYSRK